MANLDWMRNLVSASVASFNAFIKPMRSTSNFSDSLSNSVLALLYRIVGSKLPLILRLVIVLIYKLFLKVLLGQSVATLVL